jgi:hypothetical protein
LVEAVNHRRAMVASDGQVKSVSSPQSSFRPAKILPGQTEIVGIGQQDGKDSLRHRFEPGIGTFRRLAVQSARAHFPGEQGGKLDPGPITDGELVALQSTEILSLAGPGTISGTRKLVSKYSIFPPSHSA